MQPPAVTLDEHLAESNSGVMERKARKARPQSHLAACSDLIEANVFL